jgi:predicted enzyme related to lactoylglutathione lyase
MRQVSGQTDTFGKRQNTLQYGPETRETVMINGAHVILYSADAERDKAFFRDVLQFGHVDVGHGWLIFKLPPSEMAVHPSDENDLHELYLMCDDLDAEMARLKKAGVACDAPVMQAWGRLTHLALPGGGRIGLYQPRHAKP